MRAFADRTDNSLNFMNFIATLSAFCFSLVAILTLRPLAAKIGLVDKPGGRKTHSKDTPLVGGLGIYAGLLAGCLLAPEIMAHYRPLLAIASLLLLTGLVDDYYPVPAVVRLGIQVLAAWLMCSVGGNQLVSLGRLFGSQELFLGQYTTVMTVFATVGVINAINMIDGMDGLSSGLAILCLGFLATVALLEGGNPPLLGFALIALACLLAFWLLNFRAPVNKPALIYLGDSGSMMTGFILAWLLIESSQGGVERLMPATAALWFIAIPLMDTVYLFVARPLSGKSPFDPGRDHLHHLLAKHGMTTHKVVLLLYLAGLLTGLAGLVVYALPVLERFSLFGFLALFVLYIVIMRIEKRMP